MDLIKAYRPETNSFSFGQVLQSPYDFDKARIVVHEMADAAALDLVDKGMITDQIVLTVGYDIAGLKGYQGEIKTDFYGRKVPKHAHGTENLKEQTNSSRLICDAALAIYDRQVDPKLPVRRINLVVNRVVDESLKRQESYSQMDLFTDYAALEREKAERKEELAKERSIQEAMLSIKKKYGKNAILKGLNYKEGATGRDRNDQIGGHKA